jgi:hypothetical protein
MCATSAPSPMSASPTRYMKLSVRCYYVSVSYDKFIKLDFTVRRLGRIYHFFGIWKLPEIAVIPIEKGCFRYICLKGENSAIHASMSATELGMFISSPLNRATT